MTVTEAALRLFNLGTFLQDRCRPSEDGLPAKRLYAEYVVWCQRGHLAPLAERPFGLLLGTLLDHAGPIRRVHPSGAISLMRVPGARWKAALR